MKNSLKILLLTCTTLIASEVFAAGAVRELEALKKEIATYRATPLPAALAARDAAFRARDAALATNAALTKELAALKATPLPTVMASRDAAVAAHAKAQAGLDLELKRRAAAEAALATVTTERDAGKGLITEVMGALATRLPEAPPSPRRGVAALGIAKDAAEALAAERAGRIATLESQLALLADLLRTRLQGGAPLPAGAAAALSSVTDPTGVIYGLLHGPAAANPGEGDTDPMDTRPPHTGGGGAGAPHTAMGPATGGGSAAPRAEDGAEDDEDKAAKDAELRQMQAAQLASLEIFHPGTFAAPAPAAVATAAGDQTGK